MGRAALERIVVCKPMAAEATDARGELDGFCAFGTDLVVAPDFALRASVRLRHGKVVNALANVER
jgi:hypothetical protein